MECKQRRLLCIVNSIDAGGAETFLMKIYRILDKTEYQMDFYCMSIGEGFYEKEILALGGKVYHSMPKIKNFLKSFVSLKNVVKYNNYTAVMRISQHSLATLDLLAAKLGGAKTLVQRSSNSYSHSKASRTLHVIFKWLPIHIPTIRIAPSTEAAVYTFGRNCICNGKVNLIKNAIPVEDFLFSQVKRSKTRKFYNIDDKLVIGHIGRFNGQKNHKFLIDIFSEIVKLHTNSILILVGKGELENEVKSKVRTFDLSDKVIFTGVRSDVQDILMAMDVFVFPSYYEGMPNTVIEAQATGLPCIISDTITKEAQITDLVKYLSLNTSPSQWAETILNSYNYGRGQEEQKEYIKQNYKKSGYDVKTESENLMKLIFETDK